MADIKQVKLPGSETVYDICDDTARTQLQNTEAVQFNGTTTATTEALNNIIVGSKTYNIISSAPVWGGITGTLSSQTDLQTALDEKQATISDLSTIRSGAAAGATAYQKPNTGVPKTDLAADVQTSLAKADTAIQSHQDISGKENTSNKVSTWSTTTTNTHYPSEKLVKDSLDGKADSSHTHTKSDITDMPTKLSQFTNDSGFTTNIGTITGITMNGASKGTSGVVDLGTVITAHQSLSAYRTSADQDEIDSGKQDTISDLSTIRSGAAAGATAYQKPSTGIPSTDMATAVQTSLGKADTALQEHQSLSAYRTSAAQDVIDATKSTVVANPATTTASLTGLTIDGTSYGIKGMQDGSSAGDALIWTGSSWEKQNGYGYTLSGTVHQIDSKYIPHDSTKADASRVATIEGKIPSQASTSNMLADKEFVNSSINAVAAYYITSNADGEAFPTHDSLISGPWYYAGATRTPTKNDYAIVMEDRTQAIEISEFIPLTTTDDYVGYYVPYNSDYVLVTLQNKDSLGIVPGTTKAYQPPTTRYTYTKTEGAETGTWAFQYVINNAPLTAAQQAALNSGITAAKVADITSNTSARHTHSNKGVLDGITSAKITSWDGKYTKPSGGIPSSDMASAVQTSLGKADTALQSHQDISGKENTSNKVTAWSSTTTDAHYPSEKLVKSSLDGKANSSHTHTKSQITDFPTLATVATSGNYNDLSNKYSLPIATASVLGGIKVGTNLSINSSTGVLSATDTTYSVATTSANGLMSSTDKSKLDGIASGATAVTESTVSGWGFTKTTGTVTGVKINGTTKSPTSGVVDLGTVITSHQDISGKENTSNKVTAWSTTTTNTNYPSEKLVKDSLDGKAAASHTHTKSQITDMPTKLSQFTNDSGFTTNTGTVTSVAVKMNGTTKGTVTTSGTIDLGTVITAHQDVSGKENTSNKVTAWSTTTTDTNYPSEKLVKSALDGKAASSHTHTAAQVTGLATVATSGSYTDLSNKPTITDTKNTAGSTDTSSKIFLVGATSQAANPQTYSHDTAFVGTDGCLYSNSTKVSVEGHSHGRQYVIGTVAPATSGSGADTSKLYINSADGYSLWVYDYSLTTPAWVRVGASYK